MIQLTEAIEEYGNGGRALKGVAPLLVDPIAIVTVRPCRRSSAILEGSLILVDGGREYTVLENYDVIRSMVEGASFNAAYADEIPGYFNSEPPRG